MEGYTDIIKVNWPWVEVKTNFDDNSIVINMNDVSLVWPLISGAYHTGVFLKNGTWIETVTLKGLEELRDLLFTQTAVTVNEEYLDIAHELQQFSAFSKGE